VLEESPEWQAQLRTAEEKEQQLWENLNPAIRSSRRFGGPTSAGAAQNLTHAAERGVTAVDARKTTNADVRAATTRTTSRATTAATTRSTATTAATADGRLDMAGWIRGGSGGKRGASDLGGGSPTGEPTGSENPRQTEDMDPTDIKHRTDDTGISSNGRHDGSTGTGR